METEASLLTGLGENPILRRELRRLQRDRRQLMVLAVLWALIGCGVLAAFVFPEDARTIAVGLLITQVLVGLLGAASAGTGAITREREQQTWTAVGMTCLAPHEIIFGKAVTVGLAALAPILPIAPMVLVVAGVADLVEPRSYYHAPGLPEYLLAEAYLCCLVLAYAALALNASASSRRTTDATARMGLVILFSILVLPVVFTLILSRPEEAIWGWLAMLFCLFALTLAATATLVLATAASLPGYTRSYTRPLRVLGGLTYLSLIALLAASGATTGVGGEMVTVALAWHVTCISVMAVVLCAGALPGVPGGGVRQFAPLARGCGGALGCVLSLHVLGMCILPLACLDRASSVFWQLVDRIPGERTEELFTVFRVAPFATTCVLLCGAAGCLIATKLPRLAANWRMGVSVLVPMLLLLPGIAFLVGSDLPWGWGDMANALRQTLLFPIAAAFDPVMYMLAPQPNLYSVDTFSSRDLVPTAGAFVEQVLLALLLFSFTFARRPASVK